MYEKSVTLFQFILLREITKNLNIPLKDIKEPYGVLGGSVS